MKFALTTHFIFRPISLLTRMHSSRMRTARSLIVSLYLAISHACPPGSNHAHPPEQPRMPPGSNHTCPPEQPRTPPEQPCMPYWEQPRTPLSNHACPSPRSNNACPLEQPRSPPGATTHVPSGATTHAPPEQRCTPQLRCGR